MKRIVITLIVAILALPTAMYAQPKQGDREWVAKIRPEHPRLFLCADDIPQIRETARTFESETFNAIKKRTDALLGKDVVFKNELARSGESTKNHHYGHRTAEAAMMWLITQDRKYLDLTKYLVGRMTDYYQLRVSHNLNIEWYAFSQIAVLCAYDWIYNDLTSNEREEMGKRLYDVLCNVALYDKKIRPYRYRENKGNYKSGLYGPRVLPWYIALTFYGEGINDDKCHEMACSGYDLHQKMIERRAGLVGESGGCSSGTVGYGLGAYPYAEYNFIYSFRSATGIDITPQMDYMIGYMHYMEWIRLPGSCEFGVGDANHRSCKLPGNIGTHVNEIAHLFGELHPEILPKAAGIMALYNQPTSNHLITFMPLLHRFNEMKRGVVAVQERKSMRFDALGQIYMRSGTGDDDTYAMFMTERVVGNHQHFDQNNFVIYKHGYRALDSGTRPQPGLHLPYYYARTVAHNCITIRMPDEKMPKYWGGAAANEDKKTPIPNDGGQNAPMQAKLLAYEEGDEWVYIASDATKCYHEDKADKVIREFVWCAPDVFVVFDRVVSDSADYPKRWLYHTVGKPVKEKKDGFSESSQGGKSICRTLLPKGAVIEFVGGEGKQFWSDGRNWAIPENAAYTKRYKTSINNHPTFGQWRVEVSPKAASKSDYFLHIIQVGDHKLRALPKTKTVESEDCISLSFEYGGKSYSLVFDKNANYGCKIGIN